MNKLVPLCAWLLSDALEIPRLRLSSSEDFIVALNSLRLMWPNIVRCLVSSGFLLGKWTRHDESEVCVFGRQRDNRIRPKDVHGVRVCVGRLRKRRFRSKLLYSNRR